MAREVIGPIREAIAAVLLNGCDVPSVCLLLVCLHP